MSRENGTLGLTNGEGFTGLARASICMELYALTKISRIDRLPFFLTHGALRARARNGAPLSTGEIISEAQSAGWFGESYTGEFCF